MPPLPFFRGQNQIDGYAGSLVLAKLYQDDPAGCVEAFSLIDTASVDLYLADTEIVPSVIVMHSPRFFVVAIVGTENNNQQVLNIVGSIQSPEPPLPGQVNAYWGPLAKFLWTEQVKPLLQNFGTGRSVVLLGHSLGGAVVDGICALIKSETTFPVAVMTIGAPRPGDTTFAAAISDNVVRWEAPDDPVPSFPPVQWASVGANWPFSGPPPLATYVHPGIAAQVDKDGTITAGSHPMDLVDAAIAVGFGNVGPHAALEYARRLAITIPPEDLTPVLTDYDYPEFLHIYLSQLEGHLMASPGLVAATTTVYKVTIFYTYGESGPTEDWWTTQAPAVIKSTLLPAYLTARFGFAMDLFQFNYARISNALNPRQVDFALPGDAGIPSQGVIKSGPAGNIKGGGTQGASDSDALLFRLKLNNGPSARMFLHGYDGTQDNQGTFTPNATFNAAFAAFKTFLTGNTQVTFNFGTPVGLAGRKPITSIAPLLPRGATITPAAADTSLQPGSVVYIGGVPRAMVGIKGRKIVTSVGLAPITAFEVGGAAPVGSYAGAGGYYYIVQPNYQPMAYGGIERITEHKVGVPFGHPVGKKRALLSLRL